MRTWTRICWLGLLIAAAPALLWAQGKAVANDLDILTKLNDDYIQSVQHSNIKRFDEILQALGAERIGERYAHDASSGTLPEEIALEWAQSWVEKVREAYSAA